MYESQQSDRSGPNDRARSPVSPLDSNGKTWNYPPRANALGPLHDIPIDGAPNEPFHSRPMSYYDGIPKSPEPDPKAVFADLPAAPPKKRLSRPFEQPHPTNSHAQTSGHGKASAATAAVSMQANMTRADSHLRRQPAQPSSRKAPRKAPPAPLTIPKPAHQSKRPQREPSPFQGEQAPAERSGHRQGNQARKQRPAHHQGWDPLAAAPPRQQRTAHGPHRDRRHRDDLEWQGDRAVKNNRSKQKEPRSKEGRACFFFVMIMLVVAIVVIALVLTKSVH